MDEYIYIHSWLVHKEEQMLENDQVKNSVLCMDTVVSFQIHGRKAKKALKKAKAELFRLEKMLSRYIEDSDVSKINQLAGKTSVSISSETYEVLSSAARMSEISEGFFDIAVTPLLNLWDYKHSFKVPEDDEIKKTLAFINYHLRDTRVELTVSKGIMSNVKILKGSIDKKGEPVKLKGGHSIEELLNNAVTEQTLEVDVISGATVTSKSHLKALENALEQAQPKK